VGASVPVRAVHDVSVPDGRVVVGDGDPGVLTGALPAVPLRSVRRRRQRRRLNLPGVVRVPPNHSILLRNQPLLAISGAEQELAHAIHVILHAPRL